MIQDFIVGAAATIVIGGGLVWLHDRIERVAKRRRVLRDARAVYGRNASLVFRARL